MKKKVIKGLILTASYIVFLGSLKLLTEVLKDGGNQNEECN